MLGFSLPLLLLSLVAASFIPRRPPSVLAEGTMTGQNPGSGRLILPVTGGEDVPVSLTLQWERRPPAALRLNLHISDREGQDQLQKKLKVKPKRVGRHWQQKLDLRLSSAGVRTFTLSTISPESGVMRYSFIAFAATPMQRVLRIGEMFFYPALAFVLLALVMVLFPTFVNRG
ncbi:hypothetical protein [Oligoflexus tunisiensis]|uniref:hypothetical protein n=1 Tax=Oligoflexus tunisiensis TaxID=708132 RepID=UPI001C404ADD|nr:hypothetical protein [Oligoflexus tunisiensis]